MKQPYSAVQPVAAAVRARVAAAGVPVVAAGAPSYVLLV